MGSYKPFHYVNQLLKVTIWPKVLILIWIYISNRCFSSKSFNEKQFKIFAPENIQDKKSKYKNVIKKLKTEIQLGIFINPNAVILLQHSEFLCTLQINVNHHISTTDTILGLVSTDFQHGYTQIWESSTAQAFLKISNIIDQVYVSVETQCSWFFLAGVKKM